MDVAAEINMQLYEIGQAVAQRRAELDLTQAQLAKLAGLSRFTVNQLEAGKVKDLGVNKLIPLLSVLGLELATAARPEQKGLYKATVGANVSYKGQLTERLLARALATGHIPEGYESQISVILDEVPVPVVVKAVEEASKSSGTPLREIWKNLAVWSKDLHLYRGVWV
jgi:transcriptional regulator with XRE-family HTH domain